MLVFGNPTPEMHEAVSQQQQFEHDPIAFVYLLPGEAGFELSERVFGGAKIVLYKAKRLKHMVLDSWDVGQISDALGGSGQWV